MKQGQRTPVQSRSKERLDLILRTAKELIGEKGIDAVSMREIAQSAGIQIGSLYQYFPGKNTLLLTIMRDYYDRIYAETKTLLDQVTNAEELEIAGEKAILQFAEFFRSDTALANLWAGARAIPELVSEDNLDTYRNAELIVKTTLRCLPGLKENDLKPFALFLSHTMGTIVRFAGEIEKKEGEEILKECQEIFRLRLKSLIDLSKSSRKKNK
ncbi:TetR/AcrR family transcriptional regulator [Leptospira koniambonensis]|uniref:TetR/AcrR family transcriptional regulator n=2 Tax=Leptospira koniambonensis TaxID=2484950 RepID=A0A4R9J319_9LEPT|nr:TetR/AcrR family transcriptional regulator [Leptospira koniambonensis]TGL28563.1 TetR/AcrR family transcriptional regulator [Leptospira koniambonensis]